MSNIFVIGGDARQIYMSEKIAKSGRSVYTMGVPPADSHCTDTVAVREADNALAICDTVILPLPASRDGNSVNITVPGISLNFLTLAAKLVSGRHIVFGGMIPETWQFILREKNIEYYDYFSDDILIERNALPTAEGVLGVLINRLPITVKGCRVTVTGFGRCGKAVAGVLSANGAEVTVSARSPDALTEAEKMGFAAVPLSVLHEHCGNTDAIVNTIPYPVIGEKILRALGSSCLIVEIASAPFGIDFAAAGRLGITVLKESSLPGRTSPKTAGEFIAESILAKEEGKECSMKK